MIEKIGNILSELWRSKTNATYEDQEWVNYFIQWFLFHFITFTFLFTINYFTNTLIECFFITVTVYIIKKYTSALHSDTYKGCFVFTILYITLFSILSKLLIDYYLILIIIAFFGGVYILQYHIKEDEVEE